MTDVQADSPQTVARTGRTLTLDEVTTYLRVGRQLKPVILRVDLELRPGEILGLVGESGSGKTTAGRVILRLIDATAGSIVFDGREITGLSRAELRPLRGGNRSVSHDGWMFNQALDAAQTFGQREQMAVLQHATRTVKIAF